MSRRTRINTRKRQNSRTQPSIYATDVTTCYTVIRSYSLKNQWFVSKTKHNNKNAQAQAQAHAHTHTQFISFLLPKFIRLLFRLSFFAHHIYHIIYLGCSIVLCRINCLFLLFVVYSFVASYVFRIFFIANCKNFRVNDVKSYVCIGYAG